MDKPTDLSPPFDRPPRPSLSTQDKLYRVCESVEFDFGLEAMGLESNSQPAGAVKGSPADAVMRPGRGMGVVVGFEVEFLTPMGTRWSHVSAAECRRLENGSRRMELRV